VSGTAAIPLIHGREDVSCADTPFDRWQPWTPCGLAAAPPVRLRLAPSCKGDLTYGFDRL